MQSEESDTLYSVTLHVVWDTFRRALNGSNIGNKQFKIHLHQAKTTFHSGYAQIGTINMQGYHGKRVKLNDGSVSSLKTPFKSCSDLIVYLSECVQFWHYLTCLHYFFTESIYTSQTVKEVESKMTTSLFFIWFLLKCISFLLVCHCTFKHLLTTETTTTRMYFWLASLLVFLTNISSKGKETPFQYIDTNNICALP